MIAHAPRRLPPRPEPVRLPDAPPYGFVVKELAGDCGTGAYAFVRALADVRAWLLRPDPPAASRREAALRHTAELEHAPAAGEARAALLLLYYVLHDEPGIHTATAVAGVCAKLAEWAEGRGALWTAVAFAQVCADTIPGSSSAAQLLGRLAARAGDTPAALSWLRWARIAARQLGQAESYARATSLLGLVHYGRGEWSRAEERLRSAAGAARQAGEREVHADASYALAVLLYEQGRAPEAAAHAVDAAESYGPSHPRLLELAADLAWLWTEGGFYESAARLCEVLSPRVAAPERRALVHALQCRAFAAVRDEFAHSRAWDAACLALGAAPPGAARAFVFLQLARAADIRCDYFRAAAAAQSAYREAHATRQHPWARAARGMLDVLGGTNTDPAAARAVFPDRVHLEDSDPPAGDAEDEQRHAVSVLAELLAPEPEPGIPSPLARALAAGQG